MADKIEVIRCAIKLFEKKGLKFSVLDLAKELSTSKRTVYAFFENKEALIQAAVDFLFDEIDELHHQILALDIPEIDKLKRILETYPLSINLDNVNLQNIINGNPRFEKMIEARLSANWELTLAQLDRCIQDGVLRNIDRQVFRELMLSIFNSALKFKNHQEVLGEYIGALFCGLTK